MEKWEIFIFVLEVPELRLLHRSFSEIISSHLKALEPRRQTSGQVAHSHSANGGPDISPLFDVPTGITEVLHSHSF